MNVHSLIELKH